MNENRLSFGADNKPATEASVTINTREQTMFDRPHIVQPGQKQPETQQQRLKLIFETDPKNLDIISNPSVVIKYLRCDHFLSLSTSQQNSYLEQLYQTLQKSSNNCSILSDSYQIVQHGLRHNLMVIKQLQTGVIPDLTQQVGCPQDLLFQLILIGLNLPNHLVVNIIHLLCQGAQSFEKCHLELLYQWLRVKKCTQVTQRGLDILSALLDHQLALKQTVKSYFYFNGFLSGILLNTKSVQPWHFNKGFATCLWFNISPVMAEGKMQDQNNLPVLFNCFSAGFGGFECYFNKSKLYYRILPPSPYQPPTVDSNGILIQEFQTDRWHFLAVEHDKPFLARAQLIAIVNDKQVVNFSMDYPKFDKQAKLTLVSTCNNFIGSMASFILFKEPINNLQKFVQIYKLHCPDLKQFDTSAIDLKIQDKLLLTYTPWRTNGKIVYDCIDMNDGELLINCGVWGNSQQQRKPQLEEHGGIQSLLPLITFCETADQVNQFLKIVLLAFGQGYDRSPVQMTDNLFELLFQVLQTVPFTAVNCQTIQILAELRITLQDKTLSDSFFKNLIMSTDFWISTNNIEVIQEFWSFVKVIYSQNPIQHNSVFRIHNLINLMIRISDTQQRFCCEYHKKTYDLFNGPDDLSETSIEVPADNIQIQVDKYLEPIAGVLECVLTSGGNDILSEIDHLTHSLTLKSCPCFQMQVLKLIKVLLLDSKSDQECASPVEFAQRFINARGLEILLHLCANNASLDVKAMCIKLIDVLSSHANLIQMRIDTDLITYLSNVLLPPSLRQNSVANQLLRATQKRDQKQDRIQSKTLNYRVMADDQVLSPPQQLGLQFFSYQEAVAEETDHREIHSDDMQKHSEKEQTDSQGDGEFETGMFQKQVFSRTANNFKTPDLDVKSEGDEKSQEDQSPKEESEEEYRNIGPGIPVAPKGTSKNQTMGFKFGGLMLDGGDSSSEQKSEQSENKIEEEPQPEQMSQLLSFQKAKPRGLANLDLKDDDEVFQAPPSRTEHQKRFGDRILGDFDSDEDKKQNDEQPPKPTQDVLMSRNLRGGANKGFSFALGAGDSSNSDQEDESKAFVAPAPTRLRGKPNLGLIVESPKAVTQRQKQDRGLRLSLDEGNQSQNEEEKQDHKVQSGGNTGATNDIDFEDNQQTLTLPQRRAPAKPLRSLNLDTEKINELFNFGGEKGEMRDEDALDKLEQDIKELALICVESMRKKRDKPQMSEFETLLGTPELDMETKEDHQLFNKPQTVKGIKKIDIEDRKRQRPMYLTGISEEEDQQLPVSEQQSVVEGELEANSVVASSNQADDFTGELENLYTSCLEWILNRVPQSLFKTLMIDDYDKITFLPAMQVLMKLVTHSNNMVRQRALQDMFMLVQWDSQNGQAILQHYVFHSWLLELLMPYQSDRSTDSAKAVYDMGTKLHTLLLKNACVNPDEDDGFKKVNLLVRWPAVAAEKGFDLNTAHELARCLGNNLIQALGQSSSMTSSSAKNLSHITLQVHELVISSNEISPKNLADYRPGNNESILQWIQRSFLSYSFDTNDSQNLWREWDICLNVTSTWGSFFFGQKNKLSEQDSQQQEKTVKQILQNKSQDEIREIVGLLMQDNQSSHSPSAQQATKPTQSRLNILGGFKGSAEKGLKTDLASNALVFTLQAIINLICLALTQASTESDKTLQKKWLQSLELHFKYIITLSEAWKTKYPDESFYKRSQRRFAEVCSFILAFLFQEIHTQNTPKSQPLTPSNDSRSGTVSPHGDLQKTKLYQQCLKSCFIFMINLVGPEQQQNSERACHIILTDILVKQYSTSSKPLINPSDISMRVETTPGKNQSDALNTSKKQSQNQIRESFFEEFPECFQQNDWKITFFHNSHINSIINSQINIEMIQIFKQKRQQYAVRLEESEASTTQANDEILKKIQVDVMQAVSETSQQLHDNNSLVAFEVDQLVRQSNFTFNQWLKKIASGPGMWRVQPEIVFKKMRSQLLGEGQQCIMKDRASNQFSFIDDKTIEPTIFKKVYAEVPFIEKKELPFQFFTKRMHKNLVEEISQSAKQSIVESQIYSQKPERKIVIECEHVSLLKSLEKRTGSLLMTNYEIFFVYDLSSEESKTDSNIFFFNWKQDYNKPLTKRILLSDIKEIQKRRFLGQNKTLELFLMDNKTIMFDFKDIEQRDKLAKKLLRQRQNKCSNLNYYSSLDPKWILKKSGLTDDWINNKISNFQYLMSLNQLAGRSYHDLSQYPVFPWTLTLTKNNQIPDLTATCVRGGAPPTHFRDLTKNMQLLGSAERQAEFKRKYEDNEGFIGIDDRFHCGSHYSNPGIVLHYFARLQPLLEAHVVLQGKAMDHPDRIFQSVQYSYQHSLNDFSDVRELTPEFYCLPEMMKNSNLCNFGIKQDGTEVNNVILPEWSKGDPVKFIQVMREAFESKYVSSNLNSWIDYVFGYKQRDIEAVYSLNTFSKITYQVDQPGDFDITTISDKTMRSAYENQGYNFGQTPIQLFKEKHPSKLSPQNSTRVNLVVDDQSKLKIFKPVPVQVKDNSQKQMLTQPLISSEAIMFARFVDDQRIVGAKKESFIQNFVWIPKAHEQNPSISFSLGSDKKSKFNSYEQINGMDQVDRSSKRFDFPMTIIGQSSHIVKGGYWDGKIVFSPVENGVYYELTEHSTTVTTIACDKKDTTLITGTKSGEVIVWRNASADCTVEATVNPWIKLRQLNDHSKVITSIFISEEMCLFATASTDGSINIYNLWTAKMIRNFVQPNLLPIYSVVLAQSPLPICAYFTKDDHTWNSYTINGEPIFLEGSEQKTRYEEASHIVQPLVVRSSEHLEKLVYGTERGSICMRNLPSLERYRKLQVSKDFPVLTLLISPDRRFLLTGCGDGGLIVITERIEPQQNQTAKQNNVKSGGVTSTNVSSNIMSSISSFVSKQ